MTWLIQSPPNMRSDTLEKTRRWIEAGCVHSDGALTFESISAKVMEGHNQLWALIRPTPLNMVGAVVTALEPRPDGKVAWVICAAAESSAAREEVQPVLEQWARDEGCKSIVMWGRKGWAKKLKDWRIHRIEFVKEL